MAEALKDGYTPRLKKHYEDVVRPKMIEEFGTPTRCRFRRSRRSC